MHRAGYLFLQSHNTEKKIEYIESRIYVRKQMNLVLSCVVYDSKIISIP